MALKTSPVVHSFQKIFRIFRSWQDARFVKIQKLTLDLASVRAAAGVGVALSIGSFGVNSASAIDKTTWVLPVLPDKKGLVHLMNPYRQPNSDYSAGHRGVDYRVEIGQQIFAPADGTIAFAGQVANRKLLTIRHDLELVSELEPVCALLPVGTVVQVGQPIATACNDLPGYAWHCPDACVHFSLRISGKYISPLALIGGLNPSRLLPLGRIG
jgi:murein DD-endopeptidase MepM/ murein hydrolase activator NlpD